MIVSVNWLKKYVDLSRVETGELVELIGSRLVEVERVIDLASKYKNAIVVRVEECNKIAGSDHLSLCRINVGKKELVQVVCGAPNVVAGMLAVWLPPKSIVPETYGTNEEFTLESRKIMGEVSNGMLASPQELDLWDEHEGILEINGTDKHPLIGLGKFLVKTSGQAIKPGAFFAELFELNDTLLTIDPKSLTHRPDCFGIIGFAREIAGILGRKFEEPKIFEKSKINASEDLKVNVAIDNPELCPRYECVVLSKIDDSASSSGHVKTYLARSGMRPINASVDITNMLMLETGQPLHAFDYDKLCSISPSKKPEIFVRAARSGEKLVLLDGKEINLSKSDIVICAGNKKVSIPIALAGAMGGLSTAIDDKTKNVLIESATFNLYNLRGTQFRHGIFSEAITRFTKGQPAELTDYVIRSAIKQFINFTKAKVASKIVDAYPNPARPICINIAVERVNGVLGSSLTFDEIITTLENVGFKVELKGDCLEVICPWWRTDIEITEDVIEEVGRLVGYDNIPQKLPKRDFSAPKPDELGDLKMSIREILSSAGANEVLTYSFVSENLLNKAGQNPDNSYKIINSISPDLQYVRQSLPPSLLEKAQINLKDGYDEFALFEINRVHQKVRHGLTSEGVPFEENKIGLVIVNRNSHEDAFYLAKKYLTILMDRLNVPFDVVPFGDHINPYEPKRAGEVMSGLLHLGVVGELRASNLKAFKLPACTAVFEIDIDKLLSLTMNLARNGFTESRFPSVDRDLTFKIASDIPYAKLKNLIEGSLKLQNLTFELTPVSIYQGESSRDKNISFHLTFASFKKTLESEEINRIIDKVTKVAQIKLKAVIV